MHAGTVSQSARQVALVRACLAHRGLISDPASAELLSVPARWALPMLAQLVCSPPVRARFAGYLMARTAFSDQAILAGLDERITQVAILGSGLDSRPRRLARSGVTFYELDLPAVLAYKRRKQPNTGSTQVPVDLSIETGEAALRTRGWDTERPGIAMAEGLFPYLAPESIERIVGGLADLMSPGSQLVLTAAPAAPTRRRRLMQEAIAHLRREPVRSWLSAEDMLSVVRRHGWALERGQAISVSRAGVARLAATGLVLTRQQRQPD